MPDDECDLDTPAPDWLIEHPAALAVFEELGIDYCCGGKSLAYACHERGLDAAATLKQLQHHVANHSTSSMKGDRTMAIPHARPGEVIDVRPLNSALTTAKTTTLFKTDKLEVVRLVMVAGKEIAEHKAPGELTVQCLEGRIVFTARGKIDALSAGDLLYLPAKEPHSVKCLEDASLLLTMLLP